MTLASFFVSMIAAIAGVGTQPLQSPWSGHPVAPTTMPFACPAIPRLPIDFVTDGFYSDRDPTHSIIDPVKMKAYNESSGPVKREGNVVVAAADAFRTTGSAKAAQCVVAHLDELSKQAALTGKMSSSQAYFVQGWVSGAWAIAYLKIGGDQWTTSEQRARIVPWLRALGTKTEAFYDAREKESGGAQNHFYWAAVQLAATAVVANDHDEFAWAMKRAEMGIAAIANNGTLPEEMRRGTRALHYHLYAASPLVMLAEFGLPNGINLYDESHGALKHLVLVSTQGLVDASLFEQATGLPQERPDPPTAEAIGWAEPYNRRFPDPTIAKLLAEAVDHSYMYLGGLPPQ